MNIWTCVHIMLKINASIYIQQNWKPLGTKRAYTVSLKNTITQASTYSAYRPISGAPDHWQKVKSSNSRLTNNHGLKVIHKIMLEVYQTSASVYVK